MKIHKGDTVIVLTGKDKGKSGKVLRILPKRMQVIVEGVNIKKKHQKPRRAGQKGQVIESTYPIHLSNVACKDPETGKSTRVGWKFIEGKKVRISKRSGKEI